MRLNVWFRHVAGVLGVVLWAGAAAGGDGASVLAGYRLQPGDILTISVWKEPELQAEVIIRPDGALSFALAGDVKGAGRTVEEVREDIQTRIRKLIPDGVVTVAAKAVVGYRIYVVGKVNRPGDFPINRPTDVMQAISLAGGVTPFAESDSIRVLRRDSDRVVSIPFHYTQVEHGRHLEQNILLQGGDTVVVP
jgi:polysaccharide biosynthesis/export protein